MKFYSYTLMGFTLLLFLKCKPDSFGSTHLKPPVLIVVGTDISQTFKDYNKLQVDQLGQLCRIILSSKRGGTLAFETIGNPTNKSILRCNLPRLDKDSCDNLPPRDRINCKNEIKELRLEAENNIDTFLKECTGYLNKQLEVNTDINGTLRKMTSLTQEPNFTHYEKFVYLHTDGLHDVSTYVNGILQQRDTILVCSLAPPVNNFYVTSWKKSAKCNFTQEFEAPSGFVSYIRSKIK